MALRDVLRERVPADVQLTPEYKAFLALVKNAHIADSVTLREHVAQERALCEAELKRAQASNQGGTNSVRIRAVVKKHEFLKLITDKILPYLP